MLQQILQDMWIDPDLLEKLGEDQKQILFCKMREEQVRRWKIWDGQEKLSVVPRQPVKVKFLLGADGEPWTWVMGEHTSDKTVEQILEEEAREKARKLAEKETQELRKSVEAELTEILDLNQKQIVQLEAAKELNRLKDKSSPMTRRKNDRCEIFSMNDNYEKSEKKLNILGKINSDHPVKVSAAVAQWEQKVMEERTSVIYSHLRKKQLEAVKEGEELARNQEKLWEEQEKRAKEAENQIREIARRAREEHRRSSYCEKEMRSPQPQEKFLSSPQSPSQPTSICGTPVSAPRPPNRAAIIEWFNASEANRSAAIDDQIVPAPWFHGLISRQEAEEILKDKSVGSFLVRLSERIWGYAITYRDVDRCKHYLVDASESHYQFLGTDQMHHSSLGALIKFHKIEPITAAGGELLLMPCPSLFSPQLNLNSSS